MQHLWLSKALVCTYRQTKGFSPCRASVSQCQRRGAAGGEWDEVSPLNRASWGDPPQTRHPKPAPRTYHSEYVGDELHPELLAVGRPELQETLHVGAQLLLLILAEAFHVVLQLLDGHQAALGQPAALPLHLPQDAGGQPGRDQTAPAPRGESKGWSKFIPWGRMVGSSPTETGSASDGWWMGTIPDFWRKGRCRGVSQHLCAHLEECYRPSGPWALPFSWEFLSVFFMVEPGCEDKLMYPIGKLGKNPSLLSLFHLLPSFPHLLNHPGWVCLTRFRLFGTQHQKKPKTNRNTSLASLMLLHIPSLPQGCS